MTVKELVEQLNEQDPNAQVVIYTPESRYEDVEEVRVSGGLVVIDWAP